jgi:hypothetical protein
VWRVHGGWQPCTVNVSWSPSSTCSDGGGSLVLSERSTNCGRTRTTPATSLELD